MAQQTLKYDRTAFCLAYELNYRAASPWADAADGLRQLLDQANNATYENGRLVQFWHANARRQANMTIPAGTPVTVIAPVQRDGGNYLVVYDEAGRRYAEVLVSDLN